MDVEVKPIERRVNRFALYVSKASRWGQRFKTFDQARGIQDGFKKVQGDLEKTMREYELPERVTGKGVIDHDFADVWTREYENPIMCFIRENFASGQYGGKLGSIAIPRVRITTNFGLSEIVFAFNGDVMEYGATSQVAQQIASAAIPDLYGTIKYNTRQMTPETLKWVLTH